MVTYSAHSAVVPGLTRDPYPAAALLEHRWAVPLRDTIEAADGHDLVDLWVHPEDLAAIGAALD